MDSKEYKGNYRELIISKWINSNIETFKKPSYAEFETQSRYYKPLIEKFIPDKNSHILEIGCGFGGFIYSLKKLGYSNIEAIDIIPECCDFVSREFNVKAYCISVLDFFNKNNKSYDVIAAFDVIEHFSKDEIVFILQKVFQSLNENGFFIMRFPSGGSLSGLYIRYSGFTHEIAFTNYSINELFKVIGFKKVVCLPETNLFPKTPKRLIKTLINKILAKFLSVDPIFIDSANIIGIGFK